MSDTQWPRYEVFLKERTDQPHRNAGTVHAVDGEMALQNARDVFVRRPACLSLWVVPAGAILAQTAGDPPSHQDPDSTAAAAEEEVYQVFRKASQRRSMTYVEHCGQLMARSAAEAMSRAMEIYNEPPGFVWWVFRDEVVVRSEEGEEESMFAPADGKSYRLPKEYRVIAEMMEARSQRDTGGDGT